MTTNETLWFRDKSAWDYIKEVEVPRLMDKVEKGEKVRVWSAAASTGQEAYSLLMLLNDAAKAKKKPYLLDKIEITGTDISTSALFLATAARYDSMAIGRGVPADKMPVYFKKAGNVWEFDKVLKKRVTFKQFNLQNSFITLGKFDLVLCRYVAIYFSSRFKRELFSKIAKVLKPKCVFKNHPKFRIRICTIRMYHQKIHVIMSRVIHKIIILVRIIPILILKFYPVSNLRSHLL